MFRLAHSAALFITLVFSAYSGQTQATSLTVNGDEVSTTIQLPGNLRANLTIRFEQTIGLTPQSLGFSASTINPISPGLLGRLPDLTDFSIPTAFPVMISIDPPSAEGLSFEGVAEIELFTTNLHYLPDTPLRLFSSSNGQDFRDITEQISAGSYRVRGSTGQWSDFLIVADVRPLTDIVNHKFGRLQQVMSNHSSQISPSLANQFDGYIAQAWSFWNNADVSNAIKQLVKLESAVDAAAEAGQVPHIWRSARDIDNIAGMLIAEARTLRFSLGQAGTGLL